MELLRSFLHGVLIVAGTAILIATFAASNTQPGSAPFWRLSPADDIGNPDESESSGAGSSVADDTIEPN